MSRHDLTEAVVRATADQTPEPIELWEYQVTGVGGPGKARTYTAGAVARAYGAEVCYINNDSRPRPRRVCIVASRSDIATLQMLLPTLAAGAEYRATALRDLQQRLTGDHGATVALLDLDHFKSIHDRFGHLAGDQLLANIGGRLSGFAGQCGGCAYRLGGDEFLLLLPATEQPPRAVPIRELLDLRATNVRARRS